jgi:flagellar biosynthesis protein FliP
VLKRFFIFFFLGFLFYGSLTETAGAQTFSLDLGEGGSISAKFFQLLALITVLSLAPSILVMVTSFTRIVVVLSFLRNALGLHQSPPNGVLVSLAFFLTAFVMAPTLEKAYYDGVLPYLQEQISEEEAWKKTTTLLQQFMLTHVRKKDLALFMDLAGQKTRPQTPEQTPMSTLIPAFMMSELRGARFPFANSDIFPWTSSGHVAWKHSKGLIFSIRITGQSDVESPS